MLFFVLFEMVVLSLSLGGVGWERQIVWIRFFSLFHFFFVPVIIDIIVCKTIIMLYLKVFFLLLFLV